MNIMTNPNRIDKQEIQNQSPLEYIAQTPKRMQSAEYIESGIKSSLYFFMCFVKFVKVNESNKADKTIQNQLSVLLTAKLQIKQVNIAMP